MNSGIHDVWNLRRKIVHGLRRGHDPALFRVFDRQRRKVAKDFVQTQTIANKEMMERKGDAEAHGTPLRGDGARSVAMTSADRDFLLRQSMFRSLELARGVE